MKFKNILGKGTPANIENIQSDFVSLASHQLRTPLSAIKWYSEMLLAGKHGTLNKKQLQYLQEIYRANERAINLVNDLLDVSRIQEGKIHLEFRPARVDKVISEVMDNFSTLIKASKVKMNFEIRGGPLPLIETDTEKLKRVIVNLLSNSIKYTPTEGDISIIVEKTRNNVKISVTDTGIGIPQSDQQRVFQKFFRSANVIKLAPDGTGLGLFIAKSLVQAMDGKIGFESAEGKGTTFFVSLPIKS